MKIVLVGLGLIGGSLAKGIKKYRNDTLFVMDNDDKTVDLAISQGIIDSKATVCDLKDADLVIISIYPAGAMEFLRKHGDDFGKNTLVTDCCGVKSDIEQVAKDGNYRFIGGHPMAGIERSGYENSFAELFVGASMILCSLSEAEEDYNMITDFYRSLKFGRIMHATPKEHDSIIACTSQLAHIVSSAYIKNKTAAKQLGFSAGSFKDMTRVARLNSTMWANLFEENNKNLLAELDEFILNLGQYRKALAENDTPTMKQLLEDGNRLKIQIDGE